MPRKQTVQKLFHLKVYNKKYDSLVQINKNFELKIVDIFYKF